MAAPSSTFSPTAVSASAMGTRLAAAYHRSPTRHRRHRLARSCSPALPLVALATMSAASNGPYGNRNGKDGEAAVRTAFPQERPKASTKNMARGRHVPSTLRVFMIDLGLHDSAIRARAFAHLAAGEREHEPPRTRPTLFQLAVKSPDEAWERRHRGDQSGPP